MSLLRVALASLAPGPRVLDEAQSRYLVRVHRLASGDDFIAFDPAARLQCSAKLVAADAREATCELGSPEPATNCAAFSIMLIQALGKGERVDQVVRDATQLGATQIVLVESERSVVRASGREHKKLQRWQRIAAESARQCERGDVPELFGPWSLAAACAAADRHATRLVCDARSGRPLFEALVGWNPLQGLALLVGPEGGFTQVEMEVAARHGFDRVRFGLRVLRTETAAIAVLGAVQFAAGMD